MEQKSLDRILEDEVFVMIHDPKISCADIIKYVRSHISKVAMVCPECQGSGHIRTEVYDNALHGWVARSKPCNWCKEGVVPRNEMKGVEK